MSEPMKVLSGERVSVCEASAMEAEPVMCCAERESEIVTTPLLLPVQGGVLARLCGTCCNKVVCLALCAG